MAEAASTTSAVWLPLITAFGGFVSGAVLEWMRDRRSYKRDQETSATLRRDAWCERRNTFQTETLIDLQDEVFKWVNAIRETHYTRKYKSEKPELWADTLVDSELSERFGTSTDRVILLCSRVRDEQTRALTEKLRMGMAKIVYAKSESESQQGLKTITDVSSQLNERIGVLLRDLDMFESL